MALDMLNIWDIGHSLALEGAPGLTWFLAYPNQPRRRSLPG